MILPSLKPVRRTVKTLDRWQGLRRASTPQEGTFTWEENLCSAAYPALTTRPPRKQADTGVTAVWAGGKLATVKSGGLYYNGSRVCTLTTGPKKLVGLGAQVLIWPDKKSYNTADGTVKNLEASFSTTGSITVSLCTAAGTACTPTVAATAPQNPAAGAYWLDTAGDEDVLKLWDENGGVWQAVPTAYVKLAASGIGKNFAEYDSVKITGLSGTEADKINSQANAFGLTVPDRIVYGRADNYLIVAALIRAGFTSAGGSVSRDVPDLDFLTESDNRVWGCCNARNEILCCRLGDATNWYRYMGTADDSYAATVGTPGPFTGAAVHLGYVLFFKEDCIHKIYGSIPAKYQVVTTRCRGVQAGSENSLALVEETLYYKSRDGVCAYDGSLPRKISAALGEALTTGAAGGGWNDLYFIGWQNADGTHELLCYDTQNGVWHREDDLNVVQLARCGGVLYALGADGKLWAVRGDPGTEVVAWQGVTGPLGTATPDAKYPARLQLRLHLLAGSRFVAAIRYDEDGPWEPLADLRTGQERTLALPLRVRRCGSFRLKLEGAGGFELFALTVITEAGTELRR